ncbi:MAG: hypothetical protein ABSA53_32395 [Streptosporangiaceae bacterium]
MPVIGADTGGLFGCGGLGALGAGDGGGLSLTCPARIALSMVGACLGVGDLAGDVLRAALISRSASSPAWRTCSAALSRMLLVFCSVLVWY